MKRLILSLLMAIITAPALAAGRSPAVVDEGRSPAVESAEVVVSENIALELSYSVKGEL